MSSPKTNYLHRKIMRDWCPKPFDPGEYYHQMRRLAQRLENELREMKEAQEKRQIDAFLGTPYDR